MGSCQTGPCCVEARRDSPYLDPATDLASGIASICFATHPGDHLANGNEHRDEEGCQPAHVPMLRPHKPRGSVADYQIRPACLASNHECHPKADFCLRSPRPCGETGAVPARRVSPSGRHPDGDTRTGALRTPPLRRLRIVSGPSIVPCASVRQCHSAVSLLIPAANSRRSAIWTMSSHSAGS